MSTIFYDKLWFEAQNEINEVIEKEFPREKTVKTERARKDVQSLAKMYVQYVGIMRKVDLCYDQIIQPQKRLLIRKLLDGTIGRILEIKHEIVAIENSEILCFDAILTEMRLTHDDLEIPIPKYFTQDRVDELQTRNETVDAILIKYGLKEKSEDDDVVSSVEEAVCLIQKMERARQGKLRAHFMKEIYAQHQGEKTRASGSGRNPKETSEPIAQQPLQEEEQQTAIDPHTAALKIQQIWKGYTTCKNFQRDREEEMIFLEMIPNPKSSERNKLMTTLLEKVEMQRRERQREHEKLYQEALVNIKQRIVRKEGSEMTDTMRADIRNWVFTYKDRTGKLPDYPTDDQGGYQAILDKGSEAYDAPKQKIKTRKISKTPLKGSVSRISSGSKHSAGSTESSVRGPQSAFLSDIVAATVDYKEIWEERTLRKDGEEEMHDESIIEADKRDEVIKELRLQVDALMRQELERFKIALLRDKGKKGKKLRAAIRKEQKRTKKKKQKTTKKKRKEKDLTPHRTLEMLYEELIKEGIVKKYPNVTLKSYLGEPNYLPQNPEKKKEFISPTFSQADIRRTITENCILPLGSKDVHLRAPLVKSVLIVGPPRSGKTMLVNAVCSEVGATLFDLTATNLIGKYSGREGLKMLLHLVNKVGRLMQPSVILIEDVERMFVKKIPKTDKTDPKRIKKGLQKLMKGVSAEDRIVLIGTCQCPTESDIKGLGGMFNKIVCISRPDHASRYVLWEKLIQSKGGRLTNSLDISTLTKVSDGYSSGSIALAISQVLTPHRVALQKRRVLQAIEFLSPLAKFTPVYKEEEQAIRNWYLKTPIVRKKIASLEPEEKRSARTNKKDQGKEMEAKIKKKKGKKEGKKK